MSGFFNSIVAAQYFALGPENSRRDGATKKEKGQNDEMVCGEMYCFTLPSVCLGVCEFLSYTTVTI